MKYKTGLFICEYSCLKGSSVIIRFFVFLYNPIYSIIDISKCIRRFLDVGFK